MLRDLLRRGLVKARRGWATVRIWWLSMEVGREVDEATHRLREAEKREMDEDVQAAIEEINRRMPK